MRDVVVWDVDVDVDVAHIYLISYANVLSQIKLCIVIV